LLTESGLGQFYDLNQHPGVRIRRPSRREQWTYLDEPAVQQRLLDFTDGKASRVTLHIPAIHCVACVWLLENLFRLNSGIGQSQVSFPRREVSIRFAPQKLALSELVALLASIGYEPQLTLGELEKKRPDSTEKRQWLQVGIAGFAFGNIMLLSLPTYFGLDTWSGTLFHTLFGYLSLALAAPVVFYNASEYWRAALLSVRQRVLTLDVPIALGLAALYARSAFEIVSGRGEGYLDSLAGLVFFLLCGRLFQQKTHERIAFDRDYKCFFPLSVLRKTAAGEETVAISLLRVGDRLVLRNGELLPADARLVSGPASIDYSFVTGESEPAARQPGDYLYAGGQQVGGAVEVETVKPVSQSYLTSLWDHEVFRKEREDNLNTLTNRYSRRFTAFVIAVAVCAALFWLLAGQAGRGFKAFSSVLIVACPCALALAAPFALGTAQRLLARLQVFLKNALVLERMAQVDAIVFDKTGTLTAARADEISFHGVAKTGGDQQTEKFPSPLLSPGGRGRIVGSRPERRVSFEFSNAGPDSSLSLRERAGVRGIDSAENGELLAGSISTSTRATGNPDALSDFERGCVLALTRQSAHPHAARIGEWAEEAESHTQRDDERQNECTQALEVENFQEVPGRGISARVQGHEVRLGSRAWFESAGVKISAQTSSTGSVSYLAIDGEFRGAFELTHALRPEADQLLRRLSSHYELALLSGDNERERERFAALFGKSARLHFNQSPLDKLGFIRALQESGKTVMMVGDGLNDAGALKQSDVGVAVVEKIGAFSPASDVILEAGLVPRIFSLLALARDSARVVRWSFGISALYNLVGISIAAAGVLSPVICAVLMPLSSVSVVLFACGATTWAARNAGLTARSRRYFAARNPQAEASLCLPNSAFQAP
jgi:Cu+-exporting ATPase